MKSVQNLTKLAFGFWLLMGIAACLPAAPEPVGNNPLPTASMTRPSNVEIVSSETLPPPATDVPASPTPAPTLTSTAAPTWTPDPYIQYTIDDLASRSYGGLPLEDQGILATNSYFTRTLISYPSDGLTIYGFLNEPVGQGPFPVVIAIHGYIDPAIYDTLDYTTRYADALARAGFLVVHPNLRNYPPSDTGENLFRVGMAVDILNLIAVIREQAGQPGPLRKADPNAIGLWGHSMGGGISTRILTLSPEVDAAVLYGSMSGDERQNFEAINRWSDGERGLEELDFPVEQLSRISPIYFLDRIQAPVSIHHGRSDELVPLRWSVDLCERLQALQKAVECHYYEGQPHTFFGEGDTLFQQHTIDFFNRTLRPPES